MVVPRPCRCRDCRLRSALACAGIHATDSRNAVRGGAPAGGDERPRAAGSRSRRRRAQSGAAHAAAASGFERPVHPGHTSRAVQTGCGAHRARVEVSGEPATLRLETDRRLRLSRGPRSLSFDAAGPANGSARGHGPRRARTRAARLRVVFPEAGGRHGLTRRAVRQARSEARDKAPHHRCDRSRPWGRGSRRRRPPRDIRENRHAGDREEAQDIAG